MPPKIDDQFWFDRSEEMIKSAVGRLNSWADKIKDYVVWAFTIYTGSIIFTVEYKKINEGWILVILVVPYVFLFGVYWYTQAFQQPKDVSFDPRSPTQIRDAYLKGYEEKSKKTSLITALSFLSLISVALALITAFILKNAQREEAPAEPYLSGIIERTGEEKKLLVSGFFPPDTVLAVSLQQQHYDSLIKRRVYSDSTYSLLNSRSGHLQQTLPLSAKTQVVVCTVQWAGDPYKRSLQRMFKVE